MGIYITGVAICFIITSSLLVVSHFSYFTIKTSNFKRAGYHYNIATGGYDKEKISTYRYVFTVIDTLIITPMLSWIGIALVLFRYLHGRFNKPQMPEKIKEVFFKLSTAHMEKDKVEECLKEIALFYGYDVHEKRKTNNDNTGIFDDYDDDDDTFLLSEGDKDWHHEVRLDIKSKTYMTYSHPDDYSSVFYRTNEYRFEGTKLLERVIEDKAEHYAKEEYDIKDGVVLEHDIRKRMEKSPLGFERTEEKIADEIEKLKASTEWQELTGRVKYFIMFKHGKQYADNELRRYYRNEEQRIINGVSLVREDISKLGGRLEKTSYDGSCEFLTIKYEEETPEKTVNEMFGIYRDPVHYNVSVYEVDNEDVLVGELNNYISKLKVS